jgi:hypothetical protein
MKAKRKVRQLYIDGTVKAEYDSLRDAARSLGKMKKTDITHIIDACRGRRKTAYGYRWEYI